MYSRDINYWIACSAIILFTLRGGFAQITILIPFYPSMDILSSQKEYTSIKMPMVLADKIRDVAEEQGYRSVSEFVMEATRKHLKDIS